MLAFLIAVLDRIGTVPAIAALFLYSLLPIVRNTETGLAGVPPSLKYSAMALGLRGGAILRYIELPLAARTILAGVKTSAVINVGTATIAAFIGAGGYGERIVAGLAVNDMIGNESRKLDNCKTKIIQVFFAQYPPNQKQKKPLTACSSFASSAMLD